MQRLKTTFLGCGKLGKSILRGLKHQDPKNLASLTVSVTRDSSKSDIEKEFGVKVETDNNRAVEEAELVILAMKPWQMVEAAQKLARDHKKRIWVSLAAGLPLIDIARQLPATDSVYRAMPNTSATFGASMTLLYSDQKASDRESATVADFFSSVGEILWLRNEALIETLTPLTASSPAFFYLLCEGFEDYLSELDLTAAERAKIIGQTIHGVGRKISNDQRPFQDLLSEVATPGGMTLEGLKVLNEFEIRDAFRQALKAAFEKSKSLSKPKG